MATAGRVLWHVVEALTKNLMERSGVDLSECFIDGSFCMVKKRALLLARLNAVKAPPSSWQSLNAAGLVLSVSIASASPYEVWLVEQTLEERLIEPMPLNLLPLTGGFLMGRFTEMFTFDAYGKKRV